MRMYMFVHVCTKYINEEIDIAMDMEMDMDMGMTSKKFRRNSVQHYALYFPVGNHPKNIMVYHEVLESWIRTHECCIKVRCTSIKTPFLLT
jgi:hypothetical protein